MSGGDGVRLYPGVPYSYSASTPDGSVFTAGACPLDCEGKLVAAGDLVAQTEVTLKNLLAALFEAGCGPEDVVKTTVYVATTSQSDLTAAWDVVEKALGSSGPPSTAGRGGGARLQRTAGGDRGGRRRFRVPLALAHFLNEMTCWIPVGRFE
ncbi:MAG TPA: RidA family protein [Solirubrobacterales bacterium]